MTSDDQDDLAAFIPAEVSEIPTSTKTVLSESAKPVKNANGVEIISEVASE